MGSGKKRKIQGRFVVKYLIGVILFYYVFICKDFYDFEVSFTSDVRGEDRTVKNLDLQRRNEPPIVFTHVFSSFSGKDAKSKAEYDLAILSWKEAANYASDRGIGVDFVNAVLEEDLRSTPEFSNKTIILKNYFELNSDDGKVIKIPYIGEIFRVGFTEATGRYLVFTNLDIIFERTFYVDVLEIINQPVLRSMKSFEKRWRQYKEYCLLNPSSILSNMKTKVCDLDLEVMYENEALNLVQPYNVARNHFTENWIKEYTLYSKSAIKNICHHESAHPLDRMLRNFCFSSKKGTLDPFERLVTYLRNGDNEQERESVLNETKTLSDVPFGMTITRLELYDVTQLQDLTPQKVENLGKLHGKIHPGNDCFVFSIGKEENHIPEDLFQLKHPLGFKLWGFYVRNIFKENNVAWKRVSGTRRQSFTYHIGISGDNWRNRIVKQPLDMLRLQANYHAISGGRYLKAMTNYRKFPQCFTAKNYRLFKYCKRDNEENAIPHCRGFTRFSCVSTMSHNARYMFFARDFCNKLVRKRLLIEDNVVLNYCAAIRVLK
eukprot:snap_masked-scaffold_4-processed-gene-19.49-mRNA-1 protein AED:1.00 eAED:1.00 QI:0/-1/0/0/-1/1/1/0/546